MPDEGMKFLANKIRNNASIQERQKLNELPIDPTNLLGQTCIDEEGIHRVDIYDQNGKLIKKGLWNAGGNRYMHTPMDWNILSNGDYDTGAGASPMQGGERLISARLAENMSALSKGYSNFIFFPQGYTALMALNLSIVDYAGKSHFVMGDDSHISTADPLARELKSRRLGSLTRFNAQHPNISEDTNKSLRSILDNFDDDLPIIVSINSVSSVTGTAANYETIMKTIYGSKNRDKIVFINDVAHDFGVNGNGAGMFYQQHGYNGADIIAGTFSKAFQSVGGFIGFRNGRIPFDITPFSIEKKNQLLEANKDVQFAIRQQNAHVYSAAMPPVNLAILNQKAEYFLQHPEIYEQQSENAQFYYEQCRLSGLMIGNSSPFSMVKSVLLEKQPFEPDLIYNARSYLLWNLLFDEEDVYTGWFPSKSTSNGLAGVRSTINNHMQKRQLYEIPRKMARIYEKVSQPYPMVLMKYSKRLPSFFKINANS